MRKLVTLGLAVLLLVAGALPIFAQDDDTIPEEAQSATGFDTLLAAVEAAGLSDTLANEGPFTVFAPTNGAFNTLLAELGVTAEELLADTELLTSVLTYHVVEGELFAADIVAAIAETEDGLLPVETIGGATFTVELVEGVPFINGTTSVFLTDISASNGVIHAIDGVLLPPMEEMAEEEMTEEEMSEGEMSEEEMAEGEMEMGTIVDVAMGDEQFSILVDAVVAATLAETLSGEGPFTVFAPTNEAFEAALEALDMSAEELLADTELLTSVLTYHVVAGEVLAADVVALIEAGEGTAEVETVNGAALTITADDEGNVIINDTVTVVTTDIMASNGIVHVIDGVLLPPMEEMAEEEMSEGEMSEMEMAEGEMEMGTIVDVAMGDEQFSILVDAVVAAELAETLSGERLFTVFAPTNEAFEAALEALDMSAEELLADTELLTSVLTYHVVTGEVMAADVVALIEAGEGTAVVETVNGAALTITADDEGNVIINDTVTVVTTDIMASNGIVHVIDGVLLPPTE